MKSTTASARSIRLVQELGPSEMPKLWTAAPLLDAMDAEDLALARPRSYTCGHCGAPVRIRVRSVASCQDTGGRRAHFAHAFGTGADCPATGERCSTVDVVQAKRYNGKQEGERHFHLKISLADSIVSDPSFQSAGSEISVRSPDGRSRRPDVLAISTFGPLAFDLQLSPPLIDTIMGRDRTYDPSWMPHTWIIDGRNTNLLNLQGFQDLLAPQGGKILAWDEDCAALTRSTGNLTMKFITATDAGNQITAKVEFVTGSTLKTLLGHHAKTPAFAGDLPAFRRSLTAIHASLRTC